MVARITSVESIGNNNYRLVLDKGYKNNIQLNAIGKIHYFAKGKRRHSPASGSVEEIYDETAVIEANIVGPRLVPNRDIVVFDVDVAQEYLEDEVEPEDQPVAHEIPAETSDSEQILIADAPQDTRAIQRQDQLKDTASVALSDAEETAETEDTGDTGDTELLLGDGLSAIRDRVEKNKEEEEKKKQEEKTALQQQLLADIHTDAANKDWNALRDSVAAVNSHPEIKIELETFLFEMLAQVKDYDDLKILMTRIKRQLQNGNLKGLSQDIKEAEQKARNLGDKQFIAQLKKDRSRLRKLQAKSDREQRCKKIANQLQGLKNDFSEENARSLLQKYSDCSSARSYDSDLTNLMERAINQSQSALDTLARIDSKCNNNSFKNSSSFSRVKKAIAFFNRSGFNDYGLVLSSHLSETKQQCSLKADKLAKKKEQEREAFVKKFKQFQNEVDRNIGSAKDANLRSYRSTLAKFTGDAIYSNCRECNTINRKITTVLSAKKRKLEKLNDAGSYIP